MDSPTKNGMALAGIAGGLVAALAVSLPATAALSVGAILVVVLVGTWFATRDPVLLVSVPFALLIRLPFLTLRPIHDDSGTYFADAARILAGDPRITEHVGAELMMAAFLAVFGRSGPNLASLAAALATVPVVGLAASALFDDRRVAHVSAFLFALVPFHVYYSSWVYIEPLALFVLAAGFTLALRGRYLPAVALAALELVFRAEYAVLLMVPLLVLEVHDHRWIRAIIGAGPFVGLVVVTTTGALLFPDDPKGIGAFLSIIPIPVTTSYLADQFLYPIGNTAEQLIFYVPHLLHWGVPYFAIVLVNPVLPLLLVVGVVSVTRTVQAVAGSVVVLTLAVGLWVVGELAGPRPPFPTSALVVAVTAGVTAWALWRGIQASDPRTRPLLITAPYLALLIVLYMQARYLLPLTVVLTPYAGIGFVGFVDAVRAGVDSPRALVERFVGERSSKARG